MQVRKKWITESEPKGPKMITENRAENNKIVSALFSVINIYPELFSSSGNGFSVSTTNR
jgi:hypothetical protein